MSLANEIRSALKNAGKPLTGVEIYSLCPSAETVDQISVNVGSLVQRGEVRRQTVPGQRAGIFILNPNYVPGKPETGIQPRHVAGQCSTPDDDEDVTPPTKHRPAPARQHNSAPPEQTPLKKAARPALPGITNARPQHPTPVHASAPDANPAGAVVFGIRDDGVMGIDTGSGNALLDRADIARLRNFIEATKPLWI